MDTETDFRAMVEGAYNQAEAATPAPDRATESNGAGDMQGGAESGVVGVAPGVDSPGETTGTDAPVSGNNGSAGRPRGPDGKFAKATDATQAPKQATETLTGPPGGALEKSAPLPVTSVGVEPPALTQGGQP